MVLLHCGLLDKKVLDKCPIGHVSVGTMSHHPWEPVELWQVAPYFLKYSIISNLQVYVKKVISKTSTPLLEGPYALICNIFSLQGYRSTQYIVQYAVLQYIISNQYFTFFTVVNTQMKIHLIDLDTLDSKWRGIHLNHPKRERIDLIIELLQW